MRQGLTPMKAAEESIRHIISKYPSFSGAIVTANMKGEYGRSYFKSGILFFDTFMSLLIIPVAKLQLKLL